MAKKDDAPAEQPQKLFRVSMLVNGTFPKALYMQQDTLEALREFVLAAEAQTKVLHTENGSEVWVNRDSLNLAFVVQVSVAEEPLVYA